MACQTCSRQTLSLFIETVLAPQARRATLTAPFSRRLQHSRQFTSSTPRTYRSTNSRPENLSVTQDSCASRDAYIPFDGASLSLSSANAPTQTSPVRGTDPQLEKTSTSFPDSAKSLPSRRKVYEPEIKLQGELQDFDIEAFKARALSDVVANHKGHRPDRKLAKKGISFRTKKPSSDTTNAISKNKKRRAERYAGKTEQESPETRADPKQAQDGEQPVTEVEASAEDGDLNVHEAVEEGMRRATKKEAHKDVPKNNLGDSKESQRYLEEWQVQKNALKEKLDGEAWNPRKKLSPDAMEGIRAMHAQYPDRFTTPVLAKQFKISPEAVRRILKSKWRPNEDEEMDRLVRWEKRGEKIWGALVEEGVHAPKRWRELGIGGGPRRRAQQERAWAKESVPKEPPIAQAAGQSREAWVASLASRL